MQVCSSLKFFQGDSLFKASLCVVCSCFDVVFVLYTTCAPIWPFYHLNGVDAGICESSVSNDTE